MSVGRIESLVQLQPVLTGVAEGQLLKGEIVVHTAVHCTNPQGKDKYSL